MEDIPFMNDLEKLQEEYMKLQEHLVAVEMKYQNEISESNDIQQSEFVRGLFNLVVDLFGKDLYSDVVILLEDGRTMKAHRLVLYARSNDWVFTKSDTTTCTLDLADIKYDVAMMMIRWVYTDHIDIEHEGESVLVDLLKAADRFHLDSLISRCEKALIPLVNIDNCRTIIQSVQDTSAQVLKGHCFQMVHEADIDQSSNSSECYEILKTPDSYLIIAQNDINHHQSDDCAKPFQSETDLSNHVKIDNKKLSSQVKMHNKDLNNHEKMNNKDLNNHEKMNNKDLNNHEKMHNKDLSNVNNTKPFSCGICGETFLCEYNITQHVMIHTETKLEHICSICGKQYETKSGLKKHLKLHTGERPYKCDKCGKTFTDAALRRTHMLTHTDARPFSCSYCVKNFKFKGHLLVHIRLHTGDKPHQCEICGQTFAVRSHLKVHVLIHTGEKPFPCNLCDKSYRIKSHLTDHLRVHSGKREFKCEECGMEFMVKNSLTRHLRIHSSVRPHTCEKCGKTFVRKQHLIAHFRTHTGDLPYPCCFCSESFKNKSTLKSHLHLHTVEKKL